MLGGSGAKIVKQSLENDFFDRFIGTDGLRDDILIEQVGAEALATSFFSAPTSPADNPLADPFHARFDKAYGECSDKPFVDQAYDATMLIALAIEKAGSTDRKAIRDALRDVANAPGVNILNAIFRPHRRYELEQAAYEKALLTLQFLEITPLRDKLAGNLSGGKKTVETEQSLNAASQADPA